MFYDLNWHRRTGGENDT